MASGRHELDDCWSGRALELYQFAHPALTLSVIMGADLTRMFRSGFAQP
jgi:hypothetical protein